MITPRQQEESEHRARTRDFQASHGEGFWDHGSGEVEAYTKRLEVEAKQTGGGDSITERNRA